MKMEDFERNPYGGNRRNHKTRQRNFYSLSFRSGQRTYYFDVKPNNDKGMYLTITESKKRSDEDGRFFFERHKIFIYKEDFEKFLDDLKEAMQYIYENSQSDAQGLMQEELVSEDYSGGSFEELNESGF